MADGPKHAPVRLGLHFFSLFLVLGIYGPYWPLWLADRGLGPDAIGWILGSGILAKLIVAPQVAAYADKRGIRRGPLLVSALCSALVFAAFPGVDGAVALTLVTLLFFACWGPAIPLTDSLTLLVRDRQPLDYGRVRLWGSLSFMAGTVGVGFLLETEPVAIVHWTILGALGLAVVSAALLPRMALPKASVASRPFRDVAAIPGLLILILAAAAIQGSHALYYGFSVLHWQGAGLSEGTVGLLWAEGVIVEVILFAFSGLVVAKVGAERMILLGGLAAALRWALTAETTSLENLVILQALHALSFGATHLGIIQVISERAPPELSASAQSLNAIMLGLVLAGGSIASGKAYGLWQGDAFYGMAALSVLGVVACLLVVNREN